MVKEDMLVTFGSGRPKAMVMSLTGFTARIMFVEPLFGHRGNVITETGDEMNVPLKALRPLV